MVVNTLFKGAQIDEATVVTEMEGAFAVGRQHRLLQREQQVAEAALAGAVGAKDDRQRRQPDFSRIGP